MDLNDLTPVVPIKGIFYKRDDLDIRTTSNIQIRNKITSYNTNKYSKYYSKLDMLYYP